jgi:hypothetical protein
LKILILKFIQLFTKIMKTINFKGTDIPRECRVGAGHLVDGKPIETRTEICNEPRVGEGHIDSTGENLNPPIPPVQTEKE